LPKELISVVGPLKVRPPPCWMQGLVPNTGRYLAVNRGVQSPAADSDAVRSGRVPNVKERSGSVAFWDRDTDPKRYRQWRFRRQPTTVASSRRPDSSLCHAPFTNRHANGS
jgi:hypothetical protein